MSKKSNSPYTAAITGGGFLFYEFKRILPLLMSGDAETRLKDEIENNQILQVNSRKARSNFVLEFKRRFVAVPLHFWQAWQGWSEEGQRVGLFYAIMKTYKLVFDFHFNVTVRRWNSVDHQLSKSDIMQTGLLTEKTNELQSLHPDATEVAYYIHSGEEWFLEACLLYPYEIADYKLRVTNIE